MKKKALYNGGSPTIAEVKVADRLAAFRKDQGMTLQQLGAKVGLSSAYISRVENHKAAVTIATLSRLSVALRVSMSVFFEDDQENRHLTVCRSGEEKSVRLRKPVSIKVAILAWEKMGKLM